MCGQVVFQLAGDKVSGHFLDVFIGHVTFSQAGLCHGRQGAGISGVLNVGLHLHDVCQLHACACDTEKDGQQYCRHDAEVACRVGKKTVLHGFL